MPRNLARIPLCVSYGNDRALRQASRSVERPFVSIKKATGLAVFCFISGLVLGFFMGVM